MGRCVMHVARRRAFTLIELVIVMAIIAMLILIFVPQIPAIMSWYRVHMSRVIMTQLEFGVAEYNRVYGDYPHESVTWSSSDGLAEIEYWKATGYHSLYLMLQGPDGNGWGPTADKPAIKEFGPIPESPGFVGRHLSSGEAPRFEDPFGQPILYYKAHLDSRYPDINSSPYCTQWRYNWGTNRNAWYACRGANELAYGTEYVFDDAKPYALMHWRVRLTQSKVGDTRYPYNPTSYIIWMVGGDQRYGYWIWSDEYHGFIADQDPEDASDGRVGVCDDVTSF